MELKEQVEVTTPITKKKIVLRGYITGRIKQEIEAIFLNSTSMVAGQEDTPEMTFNGGVALQATNKAIELIVLSVDGSSDNVLDLVLDLPEQDFEFIKGEVNKIQRPLA